MKVSDEATGKWCLCPICFDVVVATNSLPGGVSEELSISLAAPEIQSAIAILAQARECDEVTVWRKVLVVEHRYHLRTTSHALALCLAVTIYEQKLGVVYEWTA